MSTSKKIRIRRSSVEQNKEFIAGKQRIVEVIGVHNFDDSINVKVRHSCIIFH